MSIYKSLSSVALLGFASGFSLLFPSLILMTYMLDAGLSLDQVGWVSFLSAPYLCSFLWMPVIDYMTQSIKGFRRQFMMANAILLSCCMYSYALLDPNSQYTLLMLLGLLMAIISATQDHVIEAYRLLLLPKDHYQMGVSISLVLFRLGVVIAGGGGLVFAAVYGWENAFKAASLVMALLSFSMLLLPVEQERSGVMSLEDHLRCAKGMIRKVFQNKRFLSVLLTHRLSVFWLELMLPVFLMRWVGMSVYDIGVLYKVYGMLGLIVGGIIVNRWMKTIQALVVMQGGLLVQSVVCLIFAGLSQIHVGFNVMSIILFTQCCLQGVLSTVGTVWLMHKTDKQMPAFSFSIWYGLSCFGRVFIGRIAVWIIEAYGWGNYMLLGAMIAILSTGFLFNYLKRETVYA